MDQRPSKGYNKQIIEEQTGYVSKRTYRGSPEKIERNEKLVMIYYLNFNSKVC